MSGGGGNTTTTQSGPPQQYLQAYQDVLGRANNTVNNQPSFQAYPGNLVAGLSPDQQTAIGNIQGAQGIANPYINAAAQEIGNSTTPLAPGIAGYNQQAMTALTGAQQGIQAGQQFTDAGGTPITGADINQFQDPYTQKVVNATQAEFNNQNAQQKQMVASSAAQQGAYGGDREAVSQGITAGQEALAQAPVIAGLQDKGFQTSLSAAEQQKQLQLQAGQGLYASGQALTGEAQGINATGAQVLGANEANNWLASQAGYGMANLGNEALNTSLTGSNALMGVGGTEQQIAQEQLNVPYENFIGNQAYPFQTTGWLANIAEGLGGASGGTGSTTTPGPSGLSQVLGTGLATTGILGQTGAFGNNGWLTGGSDLAAGTTSGISPAVDEALAGAALAKDGGVIRHRAGGGFVPVPTGVPDVSMSIVPGAGHGMGDAPSHPGAFNLNSSTGSTTQSSPGAGAQAQQALGDVASIAAIAALIKDGGVVPGRAPGGIVPHNILQFPLHRVNRGIAPANDDMMPHIPQRAAGGIAIPQLSTNAASSIMAPNGVAIPQLPTGGGGIAPQGGGMGAVNDYLAGNAQWQPPPPAPVPAPAPAPAPPAAAPGPAGIVPGSAQDRNFSPGGPDETDAQSQQWFLDYGGSGGSGGTARGGAIRRDDGGDIPDDLPIGMESMAPFMSRRSTTAESRDEPPSPASNEPGAMDTPLWKPIARSVGHAVMHPLEGFRDAPPPSQPVGASPGELPVSGGIAPPRGPAPDVGITDDNTTDWRQEVPLQGATGATPQIAMPDTGTGGGIAPPMPQNRPPIRPTSYQTAGNGIAPQMPPPPPPTVDATPAAAPTATQPQHSGSRAPWETLIAAGLGIMGGNSPHAAVNIGRGGLQGLQFGEQQRVREENAELRRLQQEDLAQWRQATVGVNQQKIPVLQQRADTYQQNAETNARYKDLMAQVQSGRLTMQQAQNQFMNDWRTQGQALNAADKAVRSAQGQYRLDQGDQRIQQGNQRIADARAQHDAANKIRADQYAKTNDLAERRLLQTATDSDIHAAASLAGSSGAPYLKTLKQIQAGRGDAEAGNGVAPGTTTGTAPGGQKPPLTSIFGE